MKELIVHTVTVFMGFFAIMNPIANIPIFLSLTADEDKETIRSIALRSVFYCIYYHRDIFYCR